MHTRFFALFESAFAITTGGFGTYVALLRPWQEQAEWAARMALVALSILSVSLGIVVAVRALRKK